MSPASSSNFDPGLTRQYAGPLLRVVNRDGSFNVQRTGLSGIAGSLYSRLVVTTWPRFFALTAAAYLLVNSIFASILVALGPGALHATERDLGMGAFGRSFFFSVQTLTTVGYGSVYPVGTAANLVAAAEAAVGLMGFALATGLLFARFSRPSSKLVFSGKMVVAPFQDTTSLQFRVANLRSNVLIEVEASMMLITIDRGPDGEFKRNFRNLTVELPGINFLALTWTVVHKIDETSPLFGKTHEDLKTQQAEVLILVKGFDDSFGQVVHTRYSYRWDEIEWSAKFAPAFFTAPEGHLVLHVGKIGDIARLP